MQFAEKSKLKSEKIKIKIKIRDLILLIQAFNRIKSNLISILINLISRQLTDIILPIILLNQIKLGQLLKSSK